MNGRARSEGERTQALVGAVHGEMARALGGRNPTRAQMLAWIERLTEAIAGVDMLLKAHEFTLPGK